MCIYRPYALRQTIDYYKHNSSPVFICYLDASNVFDRVKTLVFIKENPINRDIPITIIRLFVRWYGSQLYRVRWGEFLSYGFTRTNGVAHGGIRSPRFLMYILVI